MPNPTYVTLEETVLPVESVGSPPENVGADIQNDTEEFIRSLILNLDLTASKENNEQDVILDENMAETNYQCGVCGKLFSTKMDINNHMENAHEVPECNTCHVNIREKTPK